MSATSGIDISPELSQAFQRVLDAKDVRFLKVLIQSEKLVPDGTTPMSGTLEEDMEGLQELLQENSPAYILARLDGSASAWLAITYVPDSAKVRDKMLYAATRNSLLKSLGSTHFTDTLFATSKADLTPEAYVAHKAHLAAPKPLSAREKEDEETRLAERGNEYQGSQARKSHVGTGVGLAWSEEVESAMKELGEGEDSRLVVISIDPSTETLILSSSEERSVDEIANSLPTSEPSYAYFAWKHSHSNPPRREIVFIYSCPSSSPIKHRMLYSSGSSSVHQAAKSLLASSTSILASRKIETSDPKEIDESYLRSELGLTGDVSASSEVVKEDEKKPFARPKGPGRKR